MSNNKYRILVIESESNTRGFLAAILEGNNYQVILAENGINAQMLATSYCPDLILLDLGLPDMDGLSLIEFVRGWSLAPIIVISARTSEKDKVAALDMGANDYVTKPFGTAELLARMRAALRDSHRSFFNSNSSSNSINISGDRFSVRDLTIDYDKRRLSIRGEVVDLTQTEYNIIALLAQYAGRVLTYEAIIRSIWGANEPGGVKKLQVNMANIRKKLASKPDSGNYIYTEMGVGYRLLDESE